jgi:LAS superfamily LD-carboxypeptidase LdcB
MIEPDMLKKFIIFFCIILIASGFYWFTWKGGDKLSPPATNPSEPLNTIDSTKKTKFKTFTAQEFSDLYNGFAYPNTLLISNNFSVTGDKQADKIIYNLAESLGYRIRSAPVTDNFTKIDNSHVLQRKAAESWKSLKKHAEKDGIILSVSEGYRSAEDQNEIFIGRLGKIGSNKIIDRSSDSKLREILKTTAPAGYSRHHTGYTVDLVCDSDRGEKFENSICFKWISQDNYINIKKFGWIPSYPEGIKDQGPEPESWEYVWVGLDAVRE